MHISMVSFLSNLRGLVVPSSLKGLKGAYTAVNKNPIIRQSRWSAKQKEPTVTYLSTHPLLNKKKTFRTKVVKHKDSRNSRAVSAKYLLRVNNTIRKHLLLIPETLFPLSIARFSTKGALNTGKKCEKTPSGYGMPGSKGITKADDCDDVLAKKRRPKQTCPLLPPCLKFARPPGKDREYNTSKINCGRICMPCCPKARYPPVCYFPTIKKECCRVANPRPSYSECCSACLKKKFICDCCHIKPPPCRLLPEIGDLIC